MYRVENVIIPKRDDLETATVHLCETFRSLYLKDLERELPTIKRFTIALAILIFIQLLCGCNGTMYINCYPTKDL